MKITTTWLEARKGPRNRPQERYDVTVDGREGLMVRVFPSGAVSFRFRYTNDGKRRVMVLGEFGKDGLSLADAFEMHHQAQREFEKGLDPMEEREKRQAAARRARAERAGADTVASLVEQFTHRKLRGERWDESRQAWVRNLKIKARKRPEDAEALLKANLVDPTLDGQNVGRMKARELTKQQLMRLLRVIVDRGAPVTANRVHALLVQMFNWGAGQDIVPASPLAGSQPPGGKEKPRRRKLEDGEIKTIWDKLATAAMAEPTRLALKLLLVTGQRRGELTFAKKGHFDLEKMLWIIPPELQKPEGQTAEPLEPHVVPLSPLAMQLVRKLFALAPDSPWVLPSQYRKKKAGAPYSARALTRAVAENERHFGIPHWRPHDLRRACRTGLSRLKVPYDIRERVINHARPKLDQTYDQYDFLAEKRDALEKWGEHLSAIIERREQTVVAMERRM